MNSAWKSILLIVGLIALISGVVYLGLNILRMDTSTPSATSPTNQTSIESIPESLATTETTTPSAQTLVEKSCQTSAECMIVPTSRLDENGNEIITNNCVNSVFKENCQNCSISPEAAAARAKKTMRACICANNFCQFEQPVTQ